MRTIWINIRGPIVKQRRGIVILFCMIVKELGEEQRENLGHEGFGEITIRNAKRKVDHSKSKVRGLIAFIRIDIRLKCDRSVLCVLNLIRIDEIGKNHVLNE